MLDIRVFGDINRIIPRHKGVAPNTVIGDEDQRCQGAADDDRLRNGPALLRSG